MTARIPSLLASASLVLAPTVMRLAESVTPPAMHESRDDAKCVTAGGTSVYGRYADERPQSTLPGATEVVVTSTRRGWSHITYVAADRPRAGWVESTELAACASSATSEAAPIPTRAAAAAPPTSFHPYGRPVGKVAGGVLLENEAYDCMHDPDLKFCRWVGYCYRAGGRDSARYKGPFFPDERLAAGERAELADYQGLYKRDLTGFDKGHQAPDATIKAFGDAAQKETYSLANITPQYSLTNQGIWRELEDAIRGWATTSDQVCVETGPVLFKGKKPDRAGPDAVAIPHAYYAIVVRGSAPEVLGFVVPNEPTRHAWSEIETYLRSVDEIESLTGLDFLSALPDAKEATVERSAATAVWE